MGNVHTGGTDYEIHKASSAEAYRKFVFSADGRRLMGVVLVGLITRAGLYRFVIREGRDVSRIKRHVINHTLHYGYLLQPGGLGANPSDGR